MTIELEKIDRHSFPMGVLDVVIKSDEQTLWAACMDGLYELALPPLNESKSETTDGKGDGKPAEPKKTKPRRFGVHGSYVSSVACDEAAGKLYSTAFDGTLHVRDLNAVTSSLASPQENQGDSSATSDVDVPPMHAEKIHSFWSWDMQLSPDKKWIASVTGQYLAGSEEYDPAASDEPTVKIIDASTGRTVHALNMLPSVQCVCFDAASKLVAAGNLMGDLAVWDVESGRQMAAWRTKSFTSWGIIKSHCNIGGIFAVAFAPDSETLLAAGMGDMRDPMAGNGKQLWQRFAWRKETPEKVQETKGDQSGEGLMEALAWHPGGKQFVMAGRLRGGNWNAGIFDAESGNLIGQAKTGMRITTARYLQDGSQLLLAGMQGQPGPKDNHFPDFGYIERYRVVEKG
ncbi:MAG: hypothetical protein U0892_12850 [Pirellulales bacterium]